MAYFKVDEVFAQTFEIYKRNFFSIYVVSLILNIPNFVFFDFNSTSRQAGISTFLLMSGSAAYFLVQTSLLAGFIISRVLDNGLAQYKKRLEFPDISFDWIVPLIVVFLVQVTLSGVALLFLVVPGVILMIAWTYSTPIVLLEKKYTVIESLRRSWNMTKGERLHILMVFVILGFINWSIILILNFPISMVFHYNSPFAKILSEGLNVALMPIGSILIIVLYLGRRLAEIEQG